MASESDDYSHISVKNQNSHVHVNGWKLQLAGHTGQCSGKFSLEENLYMTTCIKEERQTKSKCYEYVEFG